MADNVSFRLPPPEPAHVSVIRFYDDIIAILKHIRIKGQDVIDQGFDRVSSQIGFVVATTLPVTAEIAEGGKVQQLSMRGKHLEGTLFEKELLPALKRVVAEPIPAAQGSFVRQGTYDFYLLWFEALKLRLGAGQFRPPPEPAHFRLAAELALARFRPPPEPAHFRFADELAKFLREPASSFLGRFRPPPEPAHWFDPGAFISQEEQVVIVALDEVYPELRLVERISAFRRFSEVALNPQPLPPKALAESLGQIFEPNPDPWRELREVLIRLISEPNPDPGRMKMLEELAEVIRRYRSAAP